MTIDMTITAMIAKTTWRVTNAYGSAAMRVRDAENTTNIPTTVSAACADISTQSMLRLGSPGLAPMFPSPESGLRDRNEVAMTATRRPSWRRTGR